jgi:hypothetical protein
MRHTERLISGAKCRIKVDSYVLWPEKLGKGLRNFAKLEKTEGITSLSRLLEKN